MRLVSRFLIATLFVVSASAPLFSQEKLSAEKPSGNQPTTIYVVRHAEKEGASGDIVLSATGVKRAECLASLLSDAGIQAVYTTEYRRTRMTAEPLTKKMNITAQTVPGADSAKLINALKQLDGKHVLVVGHSNTVPKIVESLAGGGFTAKVISDSEYDRLYIVTLFGNQTSVALLRYCQP